MRLGTKIYFGACLLCYFQNFSNVQFSFPQDSNSTWNADKIFLKKKILHCTTALHFSHHWQCWMNVDVSSHWLNDWQSFIISYYPSPKIIVKGPTVNMTRLNIRNFIICALLSLQSFTFGLYDGRTYVQLFENRSDFTSRVLQSDSIWVIQFYAPWCGVSWWNRFCTQIEFSWYFAFLLLVMNNERWMRAL